MNNGSIQDKINIYPRIGELIAKYNNYNDIANKNKTYYEQYNLFKGYLINFKSTLTNELLTRIIRAKNDYDSGGYKLDNGKTLDDGLLQDISNGIENIEIKLDDILTYINNKINEFNTEYKTKLGLANITKNELAVVYGVYI